MKDHFKRLEISLLIINNEEQSWIHDGLDEFRLISPKKIQIDVGNYYIPYNVQFIEKLLEIFDKSITTFNNIRVKNSGKNLSFLSRIAKNVKIVLQDDDGDEI